MSKPIKVFYSELSQRFYASSAYKEQNGHVVITGQKYDVTNQIAAAILKHDLVFAEALTPTKETSI